MCPDPPTGFTFPIVEYTHAEGFSITGGHVYRGCAMLDLADTYFYADFVTEFIRSFEVNGGSPLNAQDVTSALDPPGAYTIDGIASFGEDARGEIYVLDLYDGEVFRIVAGP